MPEDESFTAYLQKFAGISWPRWTDLPQFDLYMDQVVQFVNELITPVGMGELTPTMVNNYVKKGIIGAPKKKKYSRAQLANVIVVAILKPVFALDTIAAGISYQLVNREPQQAFDAFILTFTAAIQKVNSDFGGEMVLTGVNKTDTTVVQNAMVQLAINAVIQKLLVDNMTVLKNVRSQGKKK